MTDMKNADDIAPLLQTSTNGLRDGDPVLGPRAKECGVDLYSSC